MHKSIRLIAIAALTLFATAGVAFAASTGYIKAPANVRAGPGTGFPVIVKLPTNTKVTVEGCTPTNWCVITKGPLEGFVAKALLKKTLGGVSPFDIDIILGPDFPIQIELDDEEEEEEPFEEASVCFYQGPDLSGANFCVEPGDSDDDIPGSFDNNIESILIEGDAVVRVCSSTNLNGTCKLYDETQDELPSSISNKITSYSVED
jgi:hypothetical protein